jgi:hypothetical protein
MVEGAVFGAVVVVAAKATPQGVVFLVDRVEQVGPQDQVQPVLRVLFQVAEVAGAGMLTVHQAREPRDL